ncbi:DNA methyltransferase [Corynebacterium sp.]|uniref:DNA methyltransferase n=1 Tax=Corynebacterium sp. TaxID=1720 RepID=UPI0026DC16E4|nr:DNA methyltransferase [Corynebacterium sp.]MDO4609678.1 N-6 DNA methylase [Corynebacterium sp.]
MVGDACAAVRPKVEENHMEHGAPTAMTLDRSAIQPGLRKFATAWRERVDGWRQTGQGHTEKSFAQQFWSDLLKCFGVIPERIDLFERNAVRASTGGHGYIDLFWSGVVIGEAKSLGVDLGPAEEQLLDYLSGGSVKQHEWPKYTILSNFETLTVTKLGEEGWTVTFGIDEIDDYVDQLMFLAGQDTVTKKEEERASIEASRLMAQLFRAMVGDEVDEKVGDAAPTDPEEEDAKVQRASTWLTRLLFLLYGDDAGLWEEDLFYRFIEFDTSPGNLGSQLSALFSVLNTPENKRSQHIPDPLAKFPYVNGALFAEPLPQEFFTEDMREALLDACRFHWTKISPAIFGSMFQLVKSKEARRVHGEHYTSETNILKVLEPLFLDDLRAKARRLIRNKSTSAQDLRRFLSELGQMVFLDPACGCGNFLVVAYREVRAIETDVIVALRGKEGQLTASMDVTLDQKVSIDQFHGFELNWWPAKIAETAMFLVDHQANRQLARKVGDAPRRLPIQVTAHIVHADALQLDWSSSVPECDGEMMIFGNPPFAGHKERNADQTAGLRKAWGSPRIGHLDYVTGWFVKSVELLESRRGRFAFVSTNSVTQGEGVYALFTRIFDAGWRIQFAHRTFTWDSEAPGKAAVHCVIIGFSRSRGGDAKLYWSDAAEPSSVDAIGPYLLPGPPVLAVKPSRREILSPVLPPLRAGSTPLDWDNLVVTEAQYGEVSSDPVAAKYIRRYLGGDELINGDRRWCLWMADDDFDPADIKKSAVLRERVSRVHDKRLSRTRPATRNAAATPHLFGEIRQPESDYLALPQSFKESRRFATAAYLERDVIASVKLFTIFDEDGFIFALISSGMFIAWQKGVGGRIKSDPSVSASLVWNTWPVPLPTRAQREAIIAAGQAVLDARALHPDRSLADAYNPLAMDPTLVKAHNRLDRAVDMLFGAPRKLTTEEQRLELLFTRYAEMTAG